MMGFIIGVIAGIGGAFAFLWAVFAWDHIKPNNW